MEAGRNLEVDRPCSLCLGVADTCALLGVLQYEILVLLDVAVVVVVADKFVLLLLSEVLVISVAAVVVVVVAG